MKKDESTFYNMLDDVVRENDNADAGLKEEYLHAVATRHLQQYGKYDADKAYSGFMNVLKTYRRRRMLRRVSVAIVAAAAAIAVFIMFTGIPQGSNMSGGSHVQMPHEELASASQETPVKSGRRMPTYSASLPQITLPNGQVITLGEGNTQVDGTGFHTSGSTIRISEGSSSSDVVKLHIPRGRQYDMILSDGTHVWLNSDTELSFPLAFSGERTVTLRGQGFFDVTHTGDPFSVRCVHGTVKVMGTSFDVKDYAGEATRVTLVTGKVAFNTASTTNYLRPGEQAVQDPASHTVDIQEVNTHRYTAWKEGLIYFEDDRLEDVMHNIERIYNVHVEFQNPSLRDLTFTGECSKYKSVDEFLHVLSLTGDINFQHKGNNIIITQ